MVDGSPRLGEDDWILKPPLLKTILTDAHFWLPVAMLAFGMGLLLAMR